MKIMNLINSHLVFAMKLRNNSLIIPDGVIQLCLLYFFQIIDEFIKDKHGEGISLSMNEDNRLTKLETLDDYASAYGTFIVDFEELSNCIIEWTINLIQGNFHELSVGIIEIDNETNHELLLSNYPFCTEQLENYGLWISHTSRRIDLDSCGVTLHCSNLHTLNIAELKSIKMSIDINDKTITYFLNDKHHGLVFQDVDNSKKYQLTVATRHWMSMENTTAMLEISSFNIMHKQ